MIWSEERIADLKLRWERGESAAVIAAAIGGISRNAVLGKVNRLGLLHRNVIVHKEYKTKISKKRASRSKVAIEARRQAKLEAKLNKKMASNKFSFGKKVVSSNNAEPPTKSQLYAMLAEAVRNTAAMS